MATNTGLSTHTITVVPNPIKDYPGAFHRVHRLKCDGLQIAIVQQTVGHCCGATFIGQFSRHHWHKADIIQSVIAFYRNARLDGSNVGGSLFYVKNLNFYLSEETDMWDAEIKKVAKKVHSFANGCNTVEQWVITIWDDAVETDNDFEEDSDD